MPFSGLAPSKMNIFPKNSRVGYVCIEESFGTIFDMGYGTGKSSMPERVEIRRRQYTQIFLSKNYTSFYVKVQIIQKALNLKR